MISTIIKSTSLFASLCFITYSFGQGTVTSVVASNPPATACTNTFLTVSGTHNYGGYTYLGATATPSGSNMTISLNYSFGIGIAVITPFTQSVDIGMVPAANYTLTTNIVVNGSPSAGYISNLNVVACCGAVSSFTSSATSVCVGDSILFSNTSTGSTGQTWSDGSGFMYNSVDFGVLSTTPGPITVGLTVTNGTCSDSTQQTINVLAIPTITSITPSSTQVCIGDLLTVTAVSNGASTTSNQKWFKDGVQVGFGSTLQNVASGIGFHTIKFSAGNGACSVADSIVVEFLAPPTIDNFSVTAAICLGGTVNCSSSNTGATSLEWSIDNTPAGTTSNYSNVPTGAGVFAYQLLISNGTCADSMAQNVTVNALPVVNLGADTVYCGNAVTLDAGSGFANYAWQDASTASIFVANSAGTFSVTVTDTNGCSASDTILVTSCLGIDDLNLANIKVYPNPTSGKTLIWLGKELNEVSISILNSLGQVVVKEIYLKVNEIDIDLKDFESGVYYLSLNYGQTILITKK